MEEVARLRRVVITFGVLFLILAVVVTTALSITAIKVMSQYGLM